MKVVVLQIVGVDELDYLDVDVVEEDLEVFLVGVGVVVGEFVDEVDVEVVDGVVGYVDLEVDLVEYEYEYEYVEDICGLEFEEDDQEVLLIVVFGMLWWC